MFQAEIVKNFRINRKILPKVNNALKKYNCYRNDFPITKIANKLEKGFNLILVDEDGTKHSAIYTGREGRVVLDIAGYDEKEKKWKVATNIALTFIWYKRENKYDITTYVN